MAHGLETIWNALPLILSGAFLLLFLLGFWRGMAIRPRPDRAPEHTLPPGWPGSGVL